VDAPGPGKEDADRAHERAEQDEVGLSHSLAPPAGAQARRRHHEKTPIHTAKQANVALRVDSPSLGRSVARQLCLFASNFSPAPRHNRVAGGGTKISMQGAADIVIPSKYPDFTQHRKVLIRVGARLTWCRYPKFPRFIDGYVRRFWNWS
jgi:hypothetical protein